MAHAAGSRSRPIAQWAETLVALVFLLGAADPTPRFLGIPRVPLSGHGTGAAGCNAVAVLPTYDLPRAVRAASNPVDDFAQLIAVLRPASSPLGDALLDQASVFLERAPRTSPRDVGGGGGPPLRC